MLNGLDLFSGIGGISLALREWVRPITYCEIDRYCQAVLLSRMATGDLWMAPIWDDITTLDGSEFESEIDVIYGGFPCQDISVAGHGKGLAGERSGLFFEIVRLAKEIKPQFIFLENVPAITSRGGLQVVREIAEMGYDCRWCVISAASVGALHRRERWFLLAHSNSYGSLTNQDRQSVRTQSLQGEIQIKTQDSGQTQRASSISTHVAYAKSQRSQAAGYTFRPQETLSLHNNSNQYEIWDKEPENKFEVAGMVDGLSIRTHAIKALGNAVVPQQAKEAFKILMGM